MDNDLGDQTTQPVSAKNAGRLIKGIAVVAVIVTVIWAVAWAHAISERRHVLSNINAHTGQAVAVATYTYSCTQNTKSLPCMSYNRFTFTPKAGANAVNVVLYANKQDLVPKGEPADIIFNVNKPSEARLANHPNLPTPWALILSIPGIAGFAVVAGLVIKSAAAKTLKRS